MSLLEEFRDRAGVLANVRYDDATGRLLDLLQWLEQEQVTAKILDDLKRAVDANTLFNLGAQQRPKANTREEIARVGMHLIEICRIRKQHFFSICSEYRIAPPHRTTAVQDYTNAGMQYYVIPFLVYVEKKLIQEAENFSIASLADRSLGQVQATETRRLLPKTAAALDQLAAEFLRPEADVRWQNVGNSCRQTLIEFAAELRSACGDDMPADLKEGDVKGILRHLLTKLTTPGRFRDTLEGLLDGVWNHTQSVVHRPATSKLDASRIYLWTGLLVSEFAALLRAYNEG